MQNAKHKIRKILLVETEIKDRWTHREGRYPRGLWRSREELRAFLLSYLIESKKQD